MGCGGAGFFFWMVILVCFSFVVCLGVFLYVIFFLGQGFFLGFCVSFFFLLMFCLVGVCIGAGRFCP